MKHLHSVLISSTVNWTFVAIAIHLVIETIQTIIPEKIETKQATCTYLSVRFNIENHRYAITPTSC